MSPTDDFLGMRPGSRRRRIAQWLAVALAAAAVVVMVGRFVNGGAATRYATAPVLRADLTAKVSGAGVLLGANPRELTSDIGGVVSQIVVREGDRFAKGQVLARLDTTSLTEALADGQALIAAREAALSAASAVEREARARLRRFDAVRARSGDLVPSDREMTLARNAVRDADARQRNAAVELDAARARLAEHQARLAAADIAAPADGVVIRRLASPGQAIVAHRQPLLEVGDPSRVQMQWLVEPSTAQSLRPGAAAQVTVAGRAYAAVVKQVRPDAAKALVVLDLTNADASLRAGMTAVASLVLATHRNALVAPDAALEFGKASDAAQGAKDGSAVVYVLTDGGAPRRVPVRLLGGDGARQALIAPDLAEGMPVITGLR